MSTSEEQLQEQMRVTRHSRRAVKEQPAPEQQPVKKAQSLPVAQAPMQGQDQVSRRSSKVKKQQQQHQEADVQPKPPPLDPAPAPLMQQDTSPTSQVPQVMPSPQTSPLRIPAGMPQQMGKVTPSRMQGQQQVVQGNAGPSKRAAQPSAQQQAKQQRTDLLIPDARQDDTDCPVEPPQEQGVDSGFVITSVQGSQSFSQVSPVNRIESSTTSVRVHRNLLARAPRMRRSSGFVVKAPGGAGRNAVQGPVASQPQLQQRHTMNQQLASSTSPQPLKLNSTKSVMASEGPGQTSKQYQQQHQVPSERPAEVQQQGQVRWLIAAGSAPGSAPGSPLGSAPGSPLGSAKAQQRQPVAVYSPNSAKSSTPYEGNFSVPQWRGQPRQLAPARGARAPPPTVDLTGETSPPTASLSMVGRGTGGGGGGQEPQRRYMCSICHKYFITALALDAHSQIHQNHEKLLLSCTLCSAQYPSENGLLVHRQTYHREVVSDSGYGIPVVNVENQALVRRLNSLGIRDFVPLSVLKNDASKNFCIPILSSEDGRFSNETTKALMLSSILTFPESPPSHQ